jgi:hypothetical protein
LKVFLQNIVFFISPFIFLSLLTAQNLTDKEKLEFYPHHIGDKWSYWWVYYDPVNDYSEAGKNKLRIPQDTIVNDTTYWLIEFDYLGYGSYDYSYLERIDTLTGNVLRIDDSYSDQIDFIDNVYADVGDTVSISNNRDLLYCDNLVVLSLRDTTINNYQTTIREVIGLPQYIKLYFARNIGLLGSGENFWIDSAYVNGVFFSNITDIKEVNEPILSEFFLYQNYPNPFNPVTTINYSLFKSGFISIKIYDITGKEIKTLVKEEKQMGNYSVQFNGSNIASGVYFYRLQEGKVFSDTKKMILLR